MILPAPILLHVVICNKSWIKTMLYRKKVKIECKRN